MKFVNSKYYIALFLFWTIPNLSATYFVDAKGGNDLNSGLSITESWQSINKINNSMFSPGDSILFKNDCVWREELVLSSSGLPNNFIVLGSYGKGNPPKIMGSELITKISEISPNVWQSKLVQSVGWLWFTKSGEEIIWGTKKNNRNELLTNFDFYLDSTSVFFYCEDSLINNKLKVEASVRDFGIISGWYKAPENYIKIENLEICFTKNANVRINGGSGWEIKNVTSHHSGAIDESDGQGIQIEGKDNLVSSCSIYENGQHGIFISSFGNYDVKNNIIEKNVIYNNYHTGIDLMNDGGGQNSHSNTMIRRNLIYDDSNYQGNEIGIQTLGYGIGFVKLVTIHHNIINNIKGIGLSIVSNSDSIYIHNNTIIETQSACVSIANGDGFTELFNNIGVNNNYYAVFFLHQTNNKISDHNIWFSNTNSSTKNIYSDNIFYESIKEFQSKYGFENNGSFSDPNLSVINNNVIGLKSGSFGIDSGKTLGYSLDYFEKKIIGNTDIGAVEFIK
jgi:hypothetical protein